MNENWMKVVALAMGVGMSACAEVGSDQQLGQVSVALVSAGVGDTILVHAREAIAVVGTGAPS